MTYQVLARKWRPQDFDSLVGQQPIVTALRNALTEDRIAQAYIFSGIRGVGKTTTARVLAKALNCPTRAEQGAADPCNDCRSCTEITAGGDLDVIEVDAATYSKVEQVRELTESLRYAPANDRYKVVVLDEVHRLSRQAFDALLKIVEEPPPHLVFIFATTELDAVPATILSRCQQFQFRRVAATELAGYLRELCKRETITASDNALRLIARAAEGSVRDAVALLDQLATFGQNTVEDEAAGQLIGGMDTGVLHRLLAAILTGDSAAVRGEIKDVEGYGWDPYKVFGQFLAYLRDALHLSMKGSAEVIDLPTEEASALADLVRPIGYENVLRILTLLLDAEETVRRSEFGNLALEVTLLRAAELPKLTRIEDFLAHPGKLPNPAPGSGSGPGNQRPRSNAGTANRHAAPSTSSDRSTTQSSTTQGASDTAAPSSKPSGGAPSKPPPVNAAPEPKAQDFTTADETPQEEQASPSRNTLPTNGADTEDLLSAIRERRPPLVPHLRRADLTLADGVLTVGVPQGDALLTSALERPANATVLDQTVAALWGPDTRWSTSIIKRTSDQNAETKTGKDGAPPRPINGRNANGRRTKATPVEHHPTVKALLDVFTDGTVESVQPHENESVSN